MAIAYVPVDVPKIPYSEEKYWEFFNKHKCGSAAEHSTWEHYVTRDTNFTDEEKSSPTSPHAACKYNDGKIWWWEDAIQQELPELTNFIDNLPIRLTHVSMLSNLMLIRPHKDHAYKYSWNRAGIEKFRAESKKYEPVAYRIILAGEQQYFISHTYESYYDGNKENPSDNVLITLPEETDTFLHDATNFFHGAYLATPKIICFINGFVKQDEHKKLLDRSIKKYSDYIIDIPLDKIKQDTRGIDYEAKQQIG